MSRRLSVVIDFYRLCAIDAFLPHSPADYVRRPLVPPESPALGLSHLQFEAMITLRLSANINDFALVAMLCLLGLRIFEACGANIADLGEEHGHRVLKAHSWPPERSRHQRPAGSPNRSASFASLVRYPGQS